MNRGCFGHERQTTGNAQAARVRGAGLFMATTMKRASVMHIHTRASMDGTKMLRLLEMKIW